MYVYLNDGVVPEERAVVSVYDHGLLYGDGVYETLRAYHGMPFMPGEHMKRLERSASLIGLSLPMDTGRIMDAALETLRANSLQEAVIRITVTRGEGPPGLDPALCRRPTLVIMTRPFRPYPEAHYEKGMKVIIPRTRRNSPDALDPRIKSLNFLNNIQAMREALAAGAGEALMLNRLGRLAEGTISNVFFTRDGTLFTPSVGVGILDGVTRGVVMGLGQGAGLDVIEGEFTPEDIYGADEAFLTNTTMEVMPIGEVDDARLGAGPIARLLRQAYQGLIPG